MQEHIQSQWCFGNLVPSNYRAILCDPPWSFTTYSEKGWHKTPHEQYSCMSLEDIKALPVNSLAAPDCSLTMWTTAPMLPQAFEVLDAWGFKYKSAGAWAKQSRTGRKWAFGTGYCYRSAAEFWILGTIGKPKVQTHNVRNLIVDKIREHSRKPDEMRLNVEQLWEGPYCELFARDKSVDGWDFWGDEIGKFSPPHCDGLFQ
jgi:N6-adenosine-specific RNA methylase IME4